MAADATRYAEAVRDAGRRPLGVLADLEELVAAVSQLPLLKQMLVDAGARPPAVRERIVARQLQHFDPVVRGLVSVLAADRELDQLPEIARRLRQLLERDGVLYEVTIETPSRLSKSFKDDLAKQLARKGQRPTIHEVIKPELIGGLRLVIQDRVLDRTVAGALEQLKGVLTRG